MPQRGYATAYTCPILIHFDPTWLLIKAASHVLVATVSSKAGLYVVTSMKGGFISNALEMLMTSIAR